MSCLLPTHRVEKVWGRNSLPAPFEDPSREPIGEIWFEPPEALSNILVKYLFTSQKLSVQVHPCDADAPSDASGKDECWYILDAEPGARLAIGLQREVSPMELRAAAQDGSIESLLSWHEVSRGDFFYLPAGTIHAIGPGISLIEVQQNSDITYRLYDYGRARELHLDDAVAIARRTPYASEYRCAVPELGNVSLVDGPHFRLDRVDGNPKPADFSIPLLLVPVEGDYRVADEPVPVGSCALVREVGEIACAGNGKALLVRSA